eukprot:jgi/Chrzof1/8883/Cz03g27260.t1
MAASQTVPSTENPETTSSQSNAMHRNGYASDGNDTNQEPNGTCATLSDMEQPLLDTCEEELHVKPHSKRCNGYQTTAALLSLQLGWGLWLFPSDYARLGWLPAICKFTLEPVPGGSKGMLGSASC